MTSYTASGARRTGDEYQDLHSAEILIRWLEQPDVYRWVKLEAQDGSLDDVQAELADGSRSLWQVKFATDADDEWDWDELTHREMGKRKKPKPSLLEKWAAALSNVLNAGILVTEVGFMTNRHAGPTIRNHVSGGGIVEYDKLPDALKATLAAHLGGAAGASRFFAVFQFRFRERAIDVLEASLKERFARLGGVDAGWFNLLKKVRRWINRNDEPSVGGRIALDDVRSAALWHLPPLIPQNFHIPADYVAPAAWSDATVRLRLDAGGERIVVISGSPGAGKSTYLSWLVEVLRAAGRPVVRHHFFLSLSDRTPHRTDWETAADAINSQLRVDYPKLVAGVGGDNPAPKMLPLFLNAAGRARSGETPLVVVIDGLDHVWRNTASELGLERLLDLILPVPDGVVVVLGTQDIDVSRIPEKLRTLCPREQWLVVPMLTPIEVQDWLKHHVADLGLPSDGAHAERVLLEVGEAFYEVSRGHPLVLHFTHAAARMGVEAVRADRVRSLPDFEPKGTVAAYYQRLWDSISAEGHHLLHLLAAFPWEWPREGLLKCVAPDADVVRLETAERAIRHVLGTTRAGVTAFHESLLAFVRARSDHATSAVALRPRVIQWLSSDAPDYWRWRHECEERARAGDAEPLIECATLDWCVESLARGRARLDVAEVVAASGWAALHAGRLGEATERHYVDAYLDESRHAEGVLAALLLLALHGRNPRDRDVELNLFAASAGRASEAEIAAVAEFAFVMGDASMCRELLAEMASRWNARVGRTDPAPMGETSIDEVFPLLVAANLRSPPTDPFQKFVTQHAEEPLFCPTAPYVRALGQLCALADDTTLIRQELRYLANRAGGVSKCEAVDEFVRIACRDGFDPGGSITFQDARASGFFRCHAAWILRSAQMQDAPRIIDFSAVVRNGWRNDEVAFVELARSYFFYCVACANEGLLASSANGLSPKATAVHWFLGTLRSLGSEVPRSRRDGTPIGGAWFLARISTITLPEIGGSDFDNTLARRDTLSAVVVAVAQDLEVLHLAETGVPTLTCDALAGAMDGGWVDARAWISERVERRLPMPDADAAKLLVLRERTRLTTSLDTLHVRADHYATLAHFCRLDSRLHGEVDVFLRLAARNVLGHGYHKDMVLFDVLGAVSAAHVSATETLHRMRRIAPVVRVIDDITDSDETRYLKAELAEVVGELVPDALPPYLRALQQDGQHWVIEKYYTQWAASGPLQAVYERALGATFVHEEALTALQTRSAAGDAAATAVLQETLSYCGRAAAAPGESRSAPKEEIRDDEASAPVISEFPPSRLSAFVQACRDAGIFRDENTAQWMRYWRVHDPDAMLLALASYRDTFGYLPEKQTGPLVVGLALERNGLAGAWEWLVAYHEEIYGWSEYAYPLADVQWIWEFVKTRYETRWLEFIVATCRPKWGTAGGAPGWSVKRLVSFLNVICKPKEVAQVVDAAVEWGEGLAADMTLPEPGAALDGPPLPSTLRLLADRLDAPSRMVQERAAWSISALVGSVDTREQTVAALLDWHARDRLEMRSCFLIVVVQLAHTAHGLPTSVGAAILRTAELVPSIGAEVLLRDGDSGDADLTSARDYRGRYAPPEVESSWLSGFDRLVSAHLAPVFRSWARAIEESGIPFLRQWRCESSVLARDHGLNPRSAVFDHHFSGGVDGPLLAINDRLSMVLRSAFLRALHWAVEARGMPPEHAARFARRAAVLADSSSWAVQPTDRPSWWPTGADESTAVDALCVAADAAVRRRLDAQGSGEDASVVAFLSGPFGSAPHFRAELEVRGFLQAAHGPVAPRQEDFEESSWIPCIAIPPRGTLVGSFTSGERPFDMLADWLMAPLAWVLDRDGLDWLMPARQARGLHVPAAWIAEGLPTISCQRDGIHVGVGDRRIGSYRYWYDDLRERVHIGAGSRAGCEVFVTRESLAPHVAAGATLCWIATLSIATREQYKDRFSEYQVVRAWTIGGSRMAWPVAWSPRSMRSRKAIK